MRKVATRGAALGLALVASLALSACSLTPDTQEKVGAVGCSTSDASIASLRAGGDGARLVAALIRDTTSDDRVREVATRAAGNKGDQQGWDFLADLIEEECR